MVKYLGIGTYLFERYNMFLLQIIIKGVKQVELNCVMKPIFVFLTHDDNIIIIL
jgi:hypothetical protein